MSLRTYNETWYRLKKSILIFPLSARRDRGEAPFQAATALRPFYAAILAKAGPGRRLWFRATRLSFMLWIRFDARRIGALLGLSAERRRALRDLALRRFIDPIEIVLYDIHGDAEADTHLRRFEETAINRVINPAHWRPGCPMRDKIAFARRCAHAALPHPVMRAWRQGGRTVVDSLPPDGRLFVKPATGTGGVGVRVLDLPAGADAAQAAAFLDRELGRKVDWIGQDALTNHPDIAPYALGALSTLRITTIRDEAGRAQEVGAMMKISVDADSLADNTGRGGLSAGVDPQTGRLRQGLSWPIPTRTAANPANGVEFTGQRVPCFSDALALARRAHDDAFPEYGYVGWDIAVTQDGPVLIEGNPRGSAVFVLRPGAALVPHARILDLLALNIARASGAETAADPAIAAQ